MKMSFPGGTKHLVLCNHIRFAFYVISFVNGTKIQQFWTAKKLKINYV